MTPQEIRVRLITHTMSVVMIPAGSEDPVKDAVNALSDPEGMKICFTKAEAILKEAWELIQTAPDNLYKTEDEFLADLLQKVESRRDEQIAFLREKESLN